MNIKPNTINQYKILKHIEENFFVKSLQIILIDDNSIKIIDANKEEAIFKYENYKVNMYQNDIKLGGE